MTTTLVPISRIFIACYKGDVRLARICVASIRHWHPDVRISLIKDHSWGRFNTDDICRHWNVDILDTGERRFGWGLSTLEPLFLHERSRCLILDSDTVVLGPILDRLGRSPADFIVSGRELRTLRPEEITDHYVNMELLRPLDPQFQMPPFLFNTGQFVATTGVFARDDVSDFIDWSHGASLRHPQVFPCADQPFLNVWLHRQAQKGRLTIESIEFALWPNTTAVQNLDLKGTVACATSPVVVHWAGMRGPRLRQMISDDILRHFEDEYYVVVPNSWGSRLVGALEYYLTFHRITNRRIIG